jgi:predicted GNAT family N-acyltransferase
MTNFRLQPARHTMNGVETAMACGSAHSPLQDRRTGARLHQEAKYLGAAMLTSSIFLPSDCTAQALADFEKLVIEGGAVNPQGLAERIRKASRLLFLRAPDDQLVGVGALKHPRAAYRNRVFTDARATVSADEYPVELGWVVVTQSHQGRRLSTRIVGELLPYAKTENIFATTRADERVMSFASDYGFEINGKPYPSGHGYDLVLYLRNAARFPGGQRSFGLNR